MISSGRARVEKWEKRWGYPHPLFAQVFILLAFHPTVLDVQTSREFRPRGSMQSAQAASCERKFFEKSNCKMVLTENSCHCIRIIEIGGFGWWSRANFLRALSLELSNFMREIPRSSLSLGETILVDRRFSRGSTRPLWRARSVRSRRLLPNES